MSSELRIATPLDAKEICAIYAPIVANTVISFELQVPSVEEMERRIATTTQKLPWFVGLDGEGRVTGYAYASRHRERAAYQWSVDVSAYVREDCRKQGIASSLYASVLEQLVKLGYCQAFAGIALPNPASVGFHESMGFVPIGIYRDVGFKLGAWHDVGWWQKTLQRPAHPAVPKGLQTVSN
jgi:L-amino acid N-acyltransferase YncA